MKKSPPKDPIQIGMPSRVNPHTASASVPIEVSGVSSAIAYSDQAVPNCVPPGSDGPQWTMYSSPASVV